MRSINEVAGRDTVPLFWKQSNNNLTTGSDLKNEDLVFYIKKLKNGCNNALPSQLVNAVRSIQWRLLLP